MLQLNGFTCDSLHEIMAKVIDTIQKERNNILLSNTYACMHRRMRERERERERKRERERERERARERERDGGDRKTDKWKERDVLTKNVIVV